MIRLAWAQLRRRSGRYAALVFAVFAAACMTTVTAAFTQSLEKSVTDLFVAPYHEATLIIDAPASPNPENLYALPGVTEVNIEEDFFAHLSADDSSLYEPVRVHSLTADFQQGRGLIAGRLPDPAAPGVEVLVTDTSIELGSSATIWVSALGRNVPATVVGHTSASAQEQLLGISSVLATANHVSVWAAAEKTSTTEIRLRAQPSTELNRSVQQVVPGASISTPQQLAEQRTAEYLRDRKQYFLLLGAFVCVVAIVAALVVFASFSVLLGERQREHALLRSMGATTRQTMLTAVVESQLIAIFAVATGIPLGLYLAGAAARNADRFGVRITLAHVTPSWLVLVAIGVSTLALTALAALPAARRAATNNLVTSLQARDTSTMESTSVLRWLVLALFLLAASGGLAFNIERVPAAGVTIAALGAGMAAVLGVLILIALVFPQLALLLSRIITAPTLRLGLAYSGQQRTRASLLTALIIAATALVSAVLHGQMTIEKHLLGEHGAAGEIDVTVTALSKQDDLSTLVQHLEANPAVAYAAAPPATAVTAADGQQELVFAFSDIDGAALYRSAVSQGARPGELRLGVYSPLRSEFAHGQRATVTIAGAPTEVQVRHTNAKQSFIHPDLLRGATTHPVIFARLNTNQDADPHGDPALGQVRENLRATGLALSVQQAFGARQDINNALRRILTASGVLSVVALVIAVIGIASVLALSVRQRRRDLELLHNIGLTRWGSCVELLAEVLALAVPAAFIGAVCGGFAGLWIAEQATNQPIIVRSALSPSTVFAVVASVVVLVVLVVPSVLEISQPRRAQRGRFF